MHDITPTTGKSVVCVPERFERNGVAQEGDPLVKISFFSFFLPAPAKKYTEYFTRVRWASRLPLTPTLTQHRPAQLGVNPRCVKRHENKSCLYHDHVQRNVSRPSLHPRQEVIKYGETCKRNLMSRKRMLTIIANLIQNGKGHTQNRTAASQTSSI